MVMRLGDIDFRKKPVVPQLFLCKPNKEIVAKMNEAYGIKFNPKLGALNELTFVLPVFVERHHDIVRNKNADMIRGRYLVRLVLGVHEEYFMITKVSKIGKSGEEIEVTTLSRGYEVNDKIIRDYEAVSKTLTELVTDYLKETNWKIGYVDSEFDLKRRSVDIASNTALECVFDVAKTFNALIVWDTINRKIDFRKPDLVGSSKNFRIKWGKYLESINQEENAEEVVTRLKLYGSEGISIREINPTGTVYIEDFRNYMYPYEEVINPDGSYTVIEHSDYMSDELCHRLIAYEKLLEDNRTTFSNYIAERKAKNDILNVKNTEKFELDTQLKILLDERDVLNTRISKISDQIAAADNVGSPTSLLESDRKSLQDQLNAKLVEISSKQAQINAKEAEIAVAQADLQLTLNKINDLKNLLAIENNFTPELIEERNQYIIEKEWTDNNIESPEDLLKAGMEVFEDLKQQKITVKVDIVNFLNMISEQRNWDKLGLGDTIIIEHERLKISIEAKIIELEYDFDDQNINITISNIKDLYSNKDKFLDMLYKGNNSSTQINLDKWKWDLSLENKGSINAIINNFWDANKNAIIGAKDQVIEISDRGLIIRDPNDPLTYLVGLNGMIAITNDGGNTWKHAITGTGIVGERIYGKVIMGVNLAIEDEHGVVKWQGSLGEIFDRNGKLVMKMGLVSENPDTFGLWSFNDITRVRVDDRSGFAIDRANTDTIKYPDGWETIMWASPLDGTLYTHDLVAENIKIVNNIGKTILDAENNYLDIGDFQNIVMDNKFTTIEKIQIIAELYKIEASYKRILEQAAEYIISERDDVFDTDAQFFTKIPSTRELFSTQPLRDAYNDLITYISQFIKVDSISPLSIDVNDPLTEKTSEIPDRAEFILKFQTYYSEEENLRNKIEDAQFYSGLNMGVNYNNVVIGEYGFIALRNDGKYRAWLNATNGLALQRWENNRWVNKVYASIGSSDYQDGTLIAEDLVARRLRIETRLGGVLLDADALNFDFSVLDSIILDDAIMSTEKVTLANQYKSITKQYVALKEQINRYATTIYNDRDSSYYGLDQAQSNLVAAGNNLDAAYNALTTYMNPVFADMNKTTHIVSDLHSTRAIFHSKWEDFYKAYEEARAKLADFLEKSSLQLGRNYNNTVIDAENGVVVTRGNMKNRTTLNATEGIKIERNDGTASNPIWYKVFYVDVDGNLFAEDMSTKRLKILDGKLGEAIIFDWLTGITINGQNGEQIRLNANEGIAIDVNQEKRFWIHTDGTLRARKLIIEPDMEEDLVFDEEVDGYISDLMVNSLKTVNKNGENQDYVYIRSNFIKMYTGTGTNSSNDTLKFWLRLTDEGYGVTYPQMIWGQGNGVGGNIGYITKLPDSFKFEYTNDLNKMRALEFKAAQTDAVRLYADGGEIKIESDMKVTIACGSSKITLSSSGVKIEGARIDLN